MFLSLPAHGFLIIRSLGLSIVDRLIPTDLAICFFLVADKLFRMSSLISFHRLPPDNSDYRKKLSHFIIYYLFLFLSNYRKKLWLVNCLYVNIYIIFCPCLTIEKKLWFVNCHCVNIYIEKIWLAIEKNYYLLIVFVSTYIRFR